MSERAIRPMNVSEFLRWDDGTASRYELVEGFPLAMAPPAEAHRMLATRLACRIDGALAGRRPCNAQIDAGVIRPDRADSYYLAEIAASCTPNQRGRQEIKEPILIVEILSPGTERRDRLSKVPVYRGIGSVEEILLIDSDGVYAEVLGRRGDQWITTLVRGPDTVLRLASVDLVVTMAELYEGIDIDPDAEP